MATQRADERARLGARLPTCNPALGDLPGRIASGQHRIVRLVT